MTKSYLERAKEWLGGMAGETLVWKPEDAVLAFAKFLDEEHDLWLKEAVRPFPITKATREEEKRWKGDTLGKGVPKPAEQECKCGWSPAKHCQPPKPEEEGWKHTFVAETVPGGLKLKNILGDFGFLPWPSKEPVEVEELESGSISYGDNPHMERATMRILLLEKKVNELIRAHGKLLTVVNELVEWKDAKR